jgi:hypothetical protein
MAGPLDALERMIEEAVEGTAQRVFRPRLQPIQLAKAAVRRMEQQQVIGPSGPEVPNSYTIALNPQDLEAFARFQVALQKELEKYLLKYAADHGWAPVSEMKVLLVSDAGVPRSRPRVLAEMVDAVAAPPPLAEPAEPFDCTMRQPKLAGLPSKPPEPGGIELLGEQGERYRLTRALVRLGRALENDVVLADDRVSRFHAEIRREGARYFIRDLGSTNGTHVANEEIDQRELHNGDSISLGGYRLEFRQAS